MTIWRVKVPFVIVIGALLTAVGTAVCAPVALVAYYWIHREDEMQAEL